MTTGAGIEPADAAYMDKLTKLPRQLVFIMGCHRSGTSMLHHLMAYTGAFEYISAYDIIKYNEIISNRIEGREESVKTALDAVIKLEKNRGLDDLPIGADYPEEYRFLLDTPPTTWWLNAAGGPDAGRRIFTPQLTPEALDRFLEICRKKEFLGSGDKPLILKNPNDHYFNFGEIHRMLPDARMIFIHRHPLYILNSFFNSIDDFMQTRSAYLTMLDEKHARLLQSPLVRGVLQQLFQDEKLPQVVVSAFNQSYTYYLETVRQMPRDQYVSIRYEDLCRDPETHLEEIGRLLNLRLTPKIPEKFVAPRKLRMAPHLVAAYRDQVNDAREYLDALGYLPIPPELDEAVAG